MNLASPHKTSSLPSSLLAVQQAVTRQHFAHACDLLLFSLHPHPPTISKQTPFFSPTSRSLMLIDLAASQRHLGHLQRALTFSQQAQNEVESNQCNFRAHYEEGEAWQALDCTATAAACFQRALTINPSHVPSIQGLSFCLLAEQEPSVTNINIAATRRPNMELLRLHSTAERGRGIVTKKHHAIPDLVAEQVLTTLQAAPQTAWRCNQRHNSGSAIASANRNVVAANMSYWMYVGDDLEKLLPQLRPLLTTALQLLPHERLLINASKYVHGSYLSAHTDAPSGSDSHERVRAFVWHLSKNFTKKDGGLFIDEESNVEYIPHWNELVHFSVPRWHSVTKMTPTPIDKERISIYGWITIPNIALISSLSTFQLTLYQHRIVALYCPAAEAEADGQGQGESSRTLLDVFGAAAHCPAPGSKAYSSITRGDYIRFCVATSSWTDEMQIPIDVLATLASSPAILLYVDNVLVDRIIGIDITTVAALENMLDRAWFHFSTRISPVLRSRNGREDRMCLTAMQFNTKLPLLALIVGCSARQQSLESKDVMQICLQIAEQLKDQVFVYVTTNPRLCLSFGGIKGDQTPTAVMYGLGHRNKCSTGSTHSRTGGAFQQRLLDVAESPRTTCSFETGNIVKWVTDGITEYNIREASYVEVVKK